jgi:putative ABC transport system ATP-binding protein/lipoprotein-releasing system ATP-binding protein
MDEILARADRVGRTYSQGRTPVMALSSATCAILPGDRIALVGPSGSGKSTLLHLLSGLDTPTSGSITWPMLGAREILRPMKVGLVFQVPSLLAPLTVVENVEIPLLLGQGSREKARAEALDTLDRIGLRSIAEKLPEELSGGQAQRVAVARALASHPKLLLADEPTGQLDHPTARQLLDVLLASLEGTETALVVATHDRIVAERMNTIWHMHHGLLEVHA